jgi:hypothetical protein
MWLSSYPLPIQLLANELGIVIRSALPEAEARVIVGWGVIGYYLPLKGKMTQCFYLYPKADRLQLGFQGGLRMADPDHLLDPPNGLRQIRYVTFRSMADIQPQTLIPLLKEGVGVMS